MSDWSVVKLGGTSQCKKGYDELISMIIENPTKRYVIVLSAVSGVTDLLEKYVHTRDNNYLNIACQKEEMLESSLNLPNFLQRNYSDENFSDENGLYTQSKIIGSGEVASTMILYRYMIKYGICDVMWLSSYTFVKSKKEIFSLYPMAEFYGDIDSFNKQVGSNRIVICQGFIASTPSDKTILMGRGGSDTSGAIIANMLNASEYQVWTDVNGLYSGDPRIVENPRKINIIDYDLVAEMATMGAKVMHPFSVIPCQIKNIPIVVRNTFNLSADDTLIRKVDYDLSDRTTFVPFIVATQNGISLFKISSNNKWETYGMMGEIFRRFSENKIDVNIVTTSPNSVSTTTNESSMASLNETSYILSQDGYDVELIKGCSIVSVITPNVRNKINMIDFSTIKCHIIHFSDNGYSLNFVVDKCDAVVITNMLHRLLLLQQCV
jgi:bifunctional diaminopimelate decarboxylase / aspartate kinase